MCGICGIYHLDGRPVQKDLVGAMNSTMVHRGPDGDGVFIDGGVCLGHRRLSIIDLATGQQPLRNEDGTGWISFNGEIYNFKDLIRELEDKGHTFRTRSDTEAIVHAWEEWGTDAVKKLPAGHWALVTADAIQVQSYWDLPFFPTHELGESQMMEDLVNILEEATRIRLMSEVPLGAVFSGRVDSSAVVALMARGSAVPVKTKSISFSVAKYNEAAFARQVADLFHADHQEFHVTPEAVPIVEKPAWHYDEPFADSSAVPTYYVSETARKNVTVSLSGVAYLWGHHT